MTCDIFIRTFREHFEWLPYTLKSIRKFAKGFNEIHIVVPEVDWGSIRDIPMVAAQDIVLHRCEETTHGYLEQQISKLEADRYCQAPFILHWDIDCFFMGPTKPGDFCEGEKPIHFFESNVESPWPERNSLILGWKSPYEFMRRHPFMYPRGVYEAFRYWYQATRGECLFTSIRRLEKYGFSEYNALNAFIYRFMPHELFWKHPSEEEPKVRQLHSWTGTHEQMNEIKKLLGED